MKGEVKGERESGKEGGRVGGWKENGGRTEGEPRANRGRRMEEWKENGKMEGARRENGGRTEGEPREKDGGMEGEWKEDRRTPGGKKKIKPYTSQNFKTIIRKLTAEQMYEMEESKGEAHDEERFDREIELETIERTGLKKPLFYNRLVMGVDWNRHSTFFIIFILVCGVAGVFFFAGSMFLFFLWS
jgi:hypothetical protein